MSGIKGDKAQWSVEQAIASFPPQLRSFRTHRTSPIPFFHLLSRLKSTPRAGWIRFGIGTTLPAQSMTNGEATSEPAITTSRAESIADHMYRMSMMCMFAPSTLLQPTDGRPGIDVSRAMKMALVHDLGESIVGDITPMDGIDKEEKHRRELSAITWIAQDLCGGIESLDERGDTVKGAVGREIQELWEEYEAGRTLTSRFVKDIDKMELVVQTVEYEKDSGGRTDLSEFMWVCEKIELPEMKQWCRELIAEREAFQKSVSRPKQSSSTAETHKKRDLVDEYYA